MHEESKVTRPESLRALYASLFIFRMGFGQILVALPLYLSLLGASVSSVGIIAAANPFAEILLAVPLGRLSDRVGRKKMICAGLVCGTVVFFCYPFSTSIPLIAFLHLCLGMCEAAIIAPSMALVTDMKEKNLGREFGLVTAATTAGYVAGPIIAGILIEKSYFLPFIMSGIGALFAFIIILLFLEDGIPVSKEEMLPFRTLLSQKSMWLILALWVYAMALLSVLMTFSPLYLQSLGISPSAIGRLLGICAILLVASLLFFGGLADRMSKRLLVTFSLCVFSAGLFGMSWAHEFWSIIPFIILLGIGGGAFTPAATAWLAQMGTRFSRGTLMGMYDVVIASGNASGPLIAGVVTQRVGYWGLFIFFGVLSLMAAFLAYFGKES